MTITPEGAETLLRSLKRILALRRIVGYDNGSFHCRAWSLFTGTGVDAKLSEAG